MIIFENRDCLSAMKEFPDKHLNELQVGKAGEYLVCADLIINGFIAFPSEQGLPFDVVLEYNNRLLKVQVKTTRNYKYIPQRKTSIPGYIFGIGVNGAGAKKKTYLSNQVDIFALVDLTSKRIGYLPFFNHKSTMIFRVPEFRGQYRDEQGVRFKKQVAELKEQGLSIQEIADKLNMTLSNVYKYSSNISLSQKGTNAGTYFDEITLQRCLNKIDLFKEKESLIL